MAWRRKRQKNNPPPAPTELTLEQFWQEINTAVQTNDAVRIQQLITANPTTAEQMHQWLTESGQGTSAEAEQYRALAEIFEKFRKSDFSSILDRLHEEGLKAYYASDYPTALEKWQAGLNQSRILNEKQYIGAFLGNIGMSYHAQEQYQQALEYYAQALAIHQEFNDRSREGIILGNIGVTYDVQGQYAEALEYYEKALILYKDLGDQSSEKKVQAYIEGVQQKLGQSKIGMQKTSVGGRVVKEGEKLTTTVQAELDRLNQEGLDAAEYQTALEKWQAGLEQARALNDKRYISQFLTNLGTVYAELGQYQQALDHLDQALGIAREIGDRAAGEGTVLTNLGNVYAELRQYQRALKYYEQGLAIHRAIGDRHGEGNDLTNIGVVYDALGQYQQTLEYYEQALAIKREIGDRRGEGGDLTNLGNVYWSLGQYPRALEYYEQALTIHREIGNRNWEGNALTGLGNVYWSLGQYQQALDIHRKIGDRRGEGADLTGLGSVYWNLGQYQQALEYLEQALVIHRALGDRTAGEGTVLTNLGVVYWSLGQYQEASTAFQDSLSIHEALGTTGDLWYAQRGLASVEVKLNQPESAITHYEQALDTIEQLRAGLTEKEHKLSFMQGKLYVYDELIDLLQDLHQKHPDKGYDRKALEIFERKQGRVFLEEMGQSGARNFAGIPEATLQKEFDLDTQLEQTRKQLSDQRAKIITEQNKDLNKDLEEREKTLLSEQTALQAQIKTDYPDYYALLYPKPVALTDLQQKVLQPGELLLIYGVMKEKTCLWVVGKEAFGLYPLDIGEEALAAKVEAFRNAVTAPILDAIDRQEPINRLRRIAKRSMAEIQQTSSELSDLLIPQEVRPLLITAELVYIVPTGALYGLPFEVLMGKPTPAPSQEGNTHSPLLVGEGPGVRFLIEDHAIAYLSSASLLKILRETQSRKKAEATYPLLAFAHPVYTQTQAEAESSVRGLRTQTYLQLLGGTFMELPETADEVNEIKAALNAPDESQPLQLRENASRSKVFQFHTEARLDDYRYVVFACHGIIPEKTNQVTQPALVLSLPDPVTKTDDYLTMADVFGLQFNAELITLSACNTGRGQQVRGEGVMGLTRAFMYAGTPAISITLWSVESQSAKILSAGLYRNLKTGMSRAEALRTIKLRMIGGEEDSLYQHPFFWSPVVMFGDGIVKRRISRKAAKVQRKI